MAVVNPITSTTAVGVVTRYAITIAGALVAGMVLMGWVDRETADAINAQLPELFGAIGAVVALALPVYAAITKSRSEKAAEAAKEIDAKLPPSAPVLIKTPEGVADIVVPAKE